MAREVIAFQGERGAYSEEAVLGRFGGGAEVLPCRTLKDVFRVTEEGAAQAGLIPIENSLAGSINESYDLLLGHRLVITGETVLRVRHCLLARPGQSLADLREVYSHPQALAQCADFLDRNRLLAVAAYDTAGSARLVSGGRLPSAGAIAGRRAAELYHLDVLAEDIESDPGNYTRFYAVTRPKTSRAGGHSGTPTPAGGPDSSDPPGCSSDPPGCSADPHGCSADPSGCSKPCKTVLVFATPHVPGSLYGCLGVFAGRGLDLLKLESRPIRGRPWEYLFYADLRGHVSDTPVREALRELGPQTSWVRVLGSFQSAEAELPPGPKAGLGEAASA